MDKKQEMMKTFIESLRDDSNTVIVDGILEGFDLIMTEGIFDKVVNVASDVSRMITPSKKTPELSDKEKGLLSRKVKRQASKERQAEYAVDASKKSIEEYALINPDKVEEWIKTDLKSAIKEGKSQGVSSAKKMGLLDSIVSRHIML